MQCIDEALQPLQKCECMCLRTKQKKNAFNQLWKCLCEFGEESADSNQTKAEKKIQSNIAHECARPPRNPIFAFLSFVSIALPLWDSTNFYLVWSYFYFLFLINQLTFFFVCRTFFSVRLKSVIYFKLNKIELLSLRSHRIFCVE